MKLISLHRKYSFVDYQHHLCSFASLVTLLALLCALILPIFAIIKLKSTQSHYVVFEQPFVKFQYKYLVLAENSMREGEEMKEIMCTSFTYLQQFENETETCGKLRVLEDDTSFDGYPDEIIFTAEFPTLHNYGIKSASIVLFLDARVYDQCHFRLPTAVIIKKSFKENFLNRKISISGKLAADQSTPLVCPFFMRNVKSHFFYENLNENQTKIEEYEVEKIRERLEHNPLHLKFEETATDLGELDEDTTTIRVRVKIPEIAIRYRKSFWQRLFDSWIQFLALFVVIFAVVNFLLGKLFENRLIMSRRVNYVKDKEF